MPDASANEMEAAAARARGSSRLARLGHLLFRWRSFTPVPFLLLALPIIWRTRGVGHSPLWLISGLLACALGQAFRAWVLGQVPDGTSGQNEKLIATSLNQRGPYARTRNPLYLGNLGISLGLGLVAHSALLVALTALVFFLQYAAIISVEEAFLRERFGLAYEAYCARVPRFFPSVLPARADSAALAQAARVDPLEKKSPAWSLARALRKEHNPLAAWGLLALLFVALDRIRTALGAGAPRSLAGVGIAPELLGAALLVALWLVAKGWKHHWLSGNFRADLKRRLRETGR